MSRIFAVIVTYNPSANELKEQFDALFPQVDGIVYVDNGSESLDITYVESENTIIILNGNNLGLGKAQNIGIRKAKALGATHILLMDDDSTPAPNFVNRLLENEEHLKAQGYKPALIGARIKNLFSKEGFLTDGIRFSGFGIKHIHITDAPISVSYCIASGSLIPIDMFDKVGYINEEMFIDGLDVEWCLRAKSKGYEIFASPDAILGHRLGNGTNEKIRSHSPLREYYIIRNSIFLSKLPYVPLGYRIRRLLMPLARAAKSMLSCNWQYARKACRGIIDGLTM